MTYIFWLFVAGYALYWFFKRKPVVLSKAEAKEVVLEEIAIKEEYVLRNIQTNHLRDYMQTEKVLFDCGKKNFIRLSERFKHDDIKFGQALKDWVDYMDLINDIIHESCMLDVSTSEESGEHIDNQSNLFIKIQEIDKRFKDLLEEEYLDPKKLLHN